MLCNRLRLVPVAILSVSMLIAAGCGSEENAATTDPAAGAEDTATTADEQPITVELEEQSDSGISGTATVEPAAEGEVTVRIELDGADDGTPQPAHIHSGTCNELGGIRYPLEDVEDGTSETTVDASIGDLVSEQSAINVHKSAEEIETYVACGDIHPANGAGDAGRTETAPGLTATTDEPY